MDESDQPSKVPLWLLVSVSVILLTGVAYGRIAAVAEVTPSEELKESGNDQLTSDQHMFSVSLEVTPPEELDDSGIVRPKTNFKPKDELKDKNHELKLAKDDLKQTSDKLQKTAREVKEELRRATTEIKVTKDELRGATTEIKSTKDELRGATTEIKAIKDELRVTTSEIKVIKDELRQTNDELQEAKNNLVKARDQLVNAEHKLNTHENGEPRTEMEPTKATSKPKKTNPQKLPIDGPGKPEYGPNLLNCFDCGTDKVSEECELLEIQELPSDIAEVDASRDPGTCYIDEHLPESMDWRKFQDTAWDVPANHPPETPPHLSELTPEYLYELSLGNKTIIADHYIDDMKDRPARDLLWSTDNVEAQLQQLEGYNISQGPIPIHYRYGREGQKLWEALDRYKHLVIGRKGVVVGSQFPWVEIFALSIGAKKMITVDYQEKPSVEPYIERVTANELAHQVVDENVLFDFSISFSSMEHSGLGRYGDPLDAFGDLKAFAQTSCMVKPGGLLFLAVPIGPDCTMYNNARVYGRMRLPLVLDNWRVIDYLVAFKLTIDKGPPRWVVECGFKQPVFVLQNMRGCSNGWKSGQ